MDFWDLQTSKSTGSCSKNIRTKCGSVFNMPYYKISCWEAKRKFLWPLCWMAPGPRILWLRKCWTQWWQSKINYNVAGNRWGEKCHKNLSFTKVELHSFNLPYLFFEVDQRRSVSIDFLAWSSCRIHFIVSFPTFSNKQEKDWQCKLAYIYEN